MPRQGAWNPWAWAAPAKRIIAAKQVAAPPALARRALMADPSIAIGSVADHPPYRRAFAGRSMWLSGIRAAVFCDHPCQPVPICRDHVQMRYLFVLAAALLAGCAQIPDGVEPVGGFDAERYLGKWYEIARLDHSFERGMDNVTATYT